MRHAVLPPALHSYSWLFCCGSKSLCFATQKSLAYRRRRVKPPRPPTAGRLS
ncbi:MAG: hypothetical protein OZSIB_0534 [Candidatus Ozemobacter sibiricus]|uniref:Uncharacterized protein n=1 Tax=Candidatus Ozemobacter sibiricus TaxID=2268124 RepID=A0A367ZLL4_9BACT|nr:MAG: hypothetical protein OZSIB_0534 [Candidatus Ozemobacter sibiricus]